MKKITFILFALFTCWQINAQVSSYAFAESTETYAQITGTTSTATGDDGSESSLPIGFTFNFGGVDYTTFSINTNGWIRLGSAMPGTGTFTNTLSNTATNRPLIAVFWDDNNMTGGEIRYSLTGTAPNQVLTVNWHNTKIGGGGSTGGAAVSTLLRLYETTNVIEMVYSTPFTTTNTVTASVGLNDASSFLSVTPAATSTVSSAAANNAINAATMANLAGKKLTFTPPSCAAPAGFVASAVTSTSASISWNAAVPAPATGYEYYYSDVNTAPTGAGTPINALTDNLSGLIPNTTYYVWLRSDCGGGTFSAWSGPFTFATPCNPYSVPYFEGFESGYTHNVAVAGCISQATLTGTQVWTANSTFTDRNRTPRTGSFNAFLQYSNEDWMFIPIDLVGGTSYRVSLYARQDGATAANSNIAISYGNANNNAAMTNAIVAATGIIDGTYQEIVGDFVPATSGTYYVGIKGFMNGTPWYISLDDISITESPSCLNPTSIIASNITSNSVDLSWTDASGGLQFDYEYVIQAPGTGEPTTAGAQIGDVTVIGEGFDINGNPLTPNTLYEVYVRADCGSGFSTWSGPITFRTLCATFVAPFNEPFSTNTFPACWSQGGVTPWEFGSNVSTPAGFADYGADLVPDNTGAGGTFIGMDGSDNTDGEISTLTSPLIDITSLTTPRLKYAVFSNNVDDAARNLLQVEVWDGAAWNLVNTVSDNLGANWVVFTTDLSTLTITGPIQIRFTVTGVANGGFTFYNDILIDDVIVEETPSTAPACATNVVATPHPTCGNFSNSISWDATAGADGYNLTIGTTSGGTDILNNSDLGAVLSYSFTGSAGTTYFYTLVPYNAIGSATGCVEQSFTTNANGCYCVSAPSSVDGNGITNVELVATNFPNTVSTSPVYNDHTATVVDMSQGISNNVQISFDTGFGYDYNIVIWIDANDDYVLDASEIVYTGLVPNTPIITHNASFVMPAAMPLGQHRMRIIATDVLQTPSNPCYSGTYGETADFTVNIIAASCTPPAVASATLVADCANLQFSVDVDVTALGGGSPSITDGTTTWPVTATGVITVGPFTDATSVSLTVLHGTDSVCDLPLGSFTNTCPPVNDDCVNAIAVDCGDVVSGSTIGATDSGNNASADVWYSYSGAAGDITVSLCNNTAYDSYLRVFDACGGTEIGFNDDFCGAQSQVTFAADGTTTYYIMVEGFGTNTGSFEMAVTCVLSNGDFDANSFSAYPNPVKDVLNISYTSEISSVRVINMIGQEVLSRNINATSSQVDMSHLNAGTYIVNVTVGDAIKTLKVVKQ
ncbi:fibronectin type III domain-containing protein [Flavobacterium sp.]|uniref:fibronectin type III domain-containing protein n=1 Tax=Flavobacterium sp. TaxID=239 RepID=UPI004047A1D7